MKCIIFCPSEKRGQVRWTSPVDDERCQRNQRKMHEKLPRLTLTDNKQFRLSRRCLSAQIFTNFVWFEAKPQSGEQNGRKRKTPADPFSTKLLLFLPFLSLLLFASICCNDFPHQQRHNAERKRQGERESEREEGCRSPCGQTLCVNIDVATC